MKDLRGPKKLDANRQDRGSERDQQHPGGRTMHPAGRASKHNGSRTCLVPFLGRAGTHIGRDGFRIGDRNVISSILVDGPAHREG